MINIVLHEPAIPANTGNIARTCACIEASLHLIEPLGFVITDKTLKRAGLDYWDSLDVHKYINLDDFFAKTNAKAEECFYFSTKAKNIYSDINYPENCYLFFGREDKGLPETLIAKNYQNAVRIPMKTDMRSLNLSNSVAIASYEVLRQHNFLSLCTKGELTQTGLL